MRKFNVILLGILVIQAVLVALMHTGQGSAGATPAGSYVKLDPDTLTDVVISDADGTGVTLQKGPQGWRVPAKSNFPVDRQRLKGLLDGLNGARPDLPVAVSRDARQRFHVARDKFERHLVFHNGKDTVADLYLGDSAGSGRLYARLAGEDAIQDLRFPLWRASASVDDWLDKSYLEPKLGEQQRIALPHVTLIRTDDLWRPTDLAKNRQPDQDRIEALLDRLRTLQWDTLAGKVTDAGLPARPTFTMTLTPRKGDALVYRFYREAAPAKAEKKGAKPIWRVTRSGGDFVFTVSDDRVEPLLNADPDSLGKAKPASDNGKPADTADKPTATDG